MSSRTTSLGGIVSLLGAFLASALVLGLLLAALFIPAVGATGALARSGVDVFNELPSEFTSSPLAQQSRILAADGTVIATPQDQYRVIVPLSRVAPVMREAQVAIEDHRFYEHGGVDLQGVVRAAISNLRSGGSQGASSLTQQFVKVSLQEAALRAGDKDAAQAAVAKDYMRKLKELKYAITLEKKMSKDQILEGYLNIVYYGDRAYGVEAAAQHYFSVPAARLSLTQAALLAGLTQNPGTTDPVHFPDKALARRNVVLDRMHELGKITDEQWKAAKARTIKQDLKVSQPQSTCVASPYPYWCDFIINYLGAMPELGKTREERLRVLYRGGITVTTTLDPRIQKIAQEEVTRHVPIGDPSQVGAAAYVAQPGTGKVLAFAQNTQYTVAKQELGKTGVNWALDTKYGGSGGFQFGSTGKAFSLVTAMESGLTTKSTVKAKAAGDTPATYLPSEFPGGCGPGGKWTVLNDTPFKGGTISLMQATALSTNTAFVALAQQLGGCKVRDTVMRLGLHMANGGQIPSYAPAYILGATEVSPQGVATAYSTLASEGKRCPVVAVTRIVRGGKDVALAKSPCEQVVDPDVVRATDKFLEYNMTNGSGRRNQLDDGARQSAGKTGTADKNNESWFVGYTPQLVTAVWVGTPDDGNKRLMKNVTVGGQFYPVMHGASIAAPTWKGIMNRALEGTPRVPFNEPSPKYTGGTDTTVPRVTGMTVPNAIATLEAAGFTTAVSGSMPSSVRPGRVAATTPTGRAPRGSLVTIITSRGGSRQAFSVPPGVVPVNPPPPPGPAPTG
ncbi:MAG TPA: transglycosylase domain-containing protein [Intrasporangium sp.]|uniref:transglycosylase domain-containing protein n=1 Tax=Intrasporangium sp. TaxID=1925024 RepID=UPI002D7981DF|nr:transglycosylase domain-containing protein [Intrasporangium sp.]HET7399857.1 transglycosylase domain-containing protein [Intrasporangium sp.]